MKFFLSLFLLFSHLLCAQTHKVGVLEIEREHPIDSSTLLYVKFALEEYRKEKVDFVLMHLNTPGGEVFAATTIAEMLLEMDRVYNIPVIAVIDNWALSAGAMLSYASRYIAVSPQGIMGAAEPVMAGGSGEMKSAPEKINSALRTEMATLAKAYNRDPWIAQAMVDKDLIVVKRGKEILHLLNTEEIKKGDEVISPFGKLLTLDADELIKWNIANFRLQDTKNFAALPLLSPLEPIEFLHYTSWKINFFSFLANPLIASLLMMGLIGGIYLEMQNPGTGIFACIAIFCLSLILLSHFSFQAIDWLELIFLLSGIVLLVIEVFFFPGIFVAGILGSLLFLVGLFGLLLPSWGEQPFSFNSSNWSLANIHFIDRLEWLFISLVLSILLLLILSRFFTPLLFKKSKLILEQDQTGYVAGLLPQELPKIGAHGIVITPLLPAGKIEVEGKLYYARSDLGFLDKGIKVIVREIQGRVIIVSPLR